MDGELLRAFDSDLSLEGDGRTVVGLIAPYNEVASVDDGFGPYKETFDPGCFTRVLRGRPQYLQVQLTHNGHWVGRGHMWRDSEPGLYAELRLDNTEAGREAAFKIRDGQTPGFSIGFLPGASKRVHHADIGEVIHRQRIKAIHHVALCPMGAYASAKVEAIRVAPERGLPDRVAYWQHWTERVRRV